MSTSANIESLKPIGDSKISAGTLAYINARTLMRAYTLVIKELKQSGMTQAQLAKRLGKAPEVISRMLNRPSNWELKTFSELLFAISGAVLTFSVTHPLEKQKQVNVPFFKEQPDDMPTLQSEETKLSNVQIRRSGIRLNPGESTAGVNPKESTAAAA
jgi:transcriptional regulator with XRE-family HTH domain